MKKFLTAVIIVLLTLGLIVETVGAQGDNSGTIRGAVRQDVNGDGLCFNSGIQGEEPVAGVDIQFVSSGNLMITLVTGDNGTYGLAAAGYDNWQVAAKPGADWIVTSEPTLTAAVFPETQIVTNINFCVQKASSAAVILPTAGGPGYGRVTSIAALLGLGFVGLGVILEGRRRRVTVTS